MCVADVGDDSGKQLWAFVKELAQSNVDVHAPLTTIHSIRAPNDLLRDDLFQYFRFPYCPTILFQ